MSEKERLEILKRKLEEKKEVLYNSEKENVLQEFYNVMSLNNIYNAITGKDIFTIADFVEHDEEMAIYLIDEINSKKNDPIINEKEKAKQELIFTNPVISNTSIAMTDYYKDLKNKSDLPEGNFKQGYIDDLITKLPERKLTFEEITSLMTVFLEEINPKYKNLFNEMNEDGRIFFLDGRLKSVENYGGGCNGANFDYNDISDCIVIKSYDNDLELLGTLAHEMGHAVELMELREKVGQDEFFTYRLTSQYGEIIATLYEMKCYDFLEKKGFPSEEITKLRTKQIISSKVMVNRMFKNLYEDTYYLENYNHDLEYTTAALVSIYLNNIDKKDDLHKALKTFNKEKLTPCRFAILNKIKCDADTLDKSIQKQLKKCL